MLTNKIWPSVIYFASRCWDHSTPWWKRDRQVMWKWTKPRFKQVFRRAWRQENWIWSTNKKTNMNPGQTKATFPSCSYSQNAFFYILRENGVKARKQWHSFWRFNAVTLSAVCDKWLIKSIMDELQSLEHVTRTLVHHPPDLWANIPISTGSSIVKCSKVKIVTRWLPKHQC